MAGTINLALTQQFDMDGEPLSGGVLYFFAAATTTPQSAFQDTGLTIPWPNPIVLDASGRIPMFYLADGNIKIRLATKTGVTVIAADNLLVIGPSSGGGGGGGVDATTVMATGDIKARFSTGTLGGFVRCNGGTIGANGAAGVTERGNADCQALFEYLWSTTVLQVFSGVTPNRGTTANGDWTANKVIALPDLRGRTIAGLDDMGTGPALRLTTAGLGVGINGITLGNAGGAETRTLVTANIPSLPLTSLAISKPAVTLTEPLPFGVPGHFHSNPLSDPTHHHGFTYGTTASNSGTGGGLVVVTSIAASGGTNSVSTTDDSTGVAPASIGPTQVSPTGLTAALASTPTLSGTIGGTSAPSSIVLPTLVLMFYIKL